ncbi:type IV pilus modification PilV family protein [Microbulbifer guangxiensis]|uniref:type IV pilus modification PilV family protein n=1 Tax=Microbulbifer guangxiensis TaxID=2904249 RepID=UPI001F3C1A73|nr:prepilin-type N-terminal cleavage/methylation domain-containing protein [Microbulbifer guangxiensis]
MDRKLPLSPPQKARGIGLIEVLIAMFVLAVGVLALGRVHGDFLGISATNKARAEALAIAQGRLEDMRNYMHAANTLAEFNALYPVGVDANGQLIDGVNASFRRTESIAAKGDLRTVTVNVEWQDARGETQSVLLDTELAFIAPGAPAVLSVVPEGPLVPSPTGRARLGRGTLPEGAETTPNNDGTKMYLADGDRNLVSGDKIVLTLEDACVSAEGACENFVQIKGKVYIDNATQKSLSPQDIHLQASDAAFCTRYYVDSSGEAQTIDSASSSDLLTQTGDYRFFHYTCYLGGGWHGNIGVLLAGGIKQKDKICLGDPVSRNEWASPVIAVRRAYRGMIYGKDSTGAPMTTASGDYVYTSYGIADGIILPDPDSKDHTHDFVISAMSAGSTDGANCISQAVMVRADAAVNGVPGDLFAGNPDDFVCLNDGMLDLYDDTKYGHETTCPYDPTNPPVERHVISGQVSVAVRDDTIFSDDILASITVDTSDGPGNCQLEPFGPEGSSYKAVFACDVYDWGSGWNGAIYTAAAGNETKLTCSPSPMSLTTVSGDSDGQDIDCAVDSYALISGRVSTVDQNKVLSTVSIADGSCTVSKSGLSYECVTAAYDSGWDGTLTFELSGGAICATAGTGNDGSLTLSSGSGSAEAVAVKITGYNQLDIQIQNRLNQCPG